MLLAYLNLLFLCRIWIGADNIRRDADANVDIFGCLILYRAGAESDRRRIYIVKQYVYTYRTICLSIINLVKS